MASISLSSISSGEENYMMAIAEKYRDVHELGEGMSSDGTTVQEDSDNADCSWKTAVPVRKKSKKRPRIRSNSDGVLHEKNNKIPKFSRSTPTHSEGKVVIVGLEHKNVCRANPVNLNEIFLGLERLVNEKELAITYSFAEAVVLLILSVSKRGAASARFISSRINQLESELHLRPDLTREVISSFWDQIGQRISKDENEWKTFFDEFAEQEGTEHIKMRTIARVSNELPDFPLLAFATCVGEVAAIGAAVATVHARPYLMFGTATDAQETISSTRYPNTADNVHSIA